MRTGTVYANNDTTQYITLTRDDNDNVLVSFDLHIKASDTLEFTLPDWARAKEEQYQFTGGAVLKAPAGDIVYKMTALLEDNENLSFSAFTEQDYAGSFSYIAQTATGGVILDGVALYCIAKIETSVQPVMFESRRNHQGEIVTSGTQDMALKKEWKVTTIPLVDEPYCIYHKTGEELYSVTTEEMEKMLYETSMIGMYRAFHYDGIDYSVVIDTNITVAENHVFLEGGVYKTAKTYTFTIVEV